MSLEYSYYIRRGTLIHATEEHCTVTKMRYKGLTEGLITINYAHGNITDYQ